MGGQTRIRRHTTATHKDEKGAVVRVLVSRLHDQELVEEQGGDEAAQAEGEGDAHGGDGDGLAPVPLQDLRVELHAHQEEVQHQPG